MTESTTHRTAADPAGPPPASAPRFGPRRRRVAGVLAVLVGMGLATGAIAAPAARAGEPMLGTEVTFLSCVDDVVDEPGVDGRALVRVRVDNPLGIDVVVSGGGWRVVVDDEPVAEGAFVTPADLVSGATWEQVVAIPGDTGPATFNAGIEITQGMADPYVLFAERVEVPGDCPQPDEDGKDGEPTTTDVPPTTPEPLDVRPADVVRVTPAFTG